MRLIVTGAAGFIGMHVAEKLLRKNHEVIGIDNLNDYYDVNLKRKRLNILKKYKKFIFFKTSIENQKKINLIFKKYKPKKVIHLAAQAGVRYSIKNPHAYINSNVLGFINILESSRKFGCKHLIYASSSSVYGGTKKYPFKENFYLDKPMSIYAASKKSNELMAHVYSHLYKLPTTGLRFFTVYGPWGRPDMSLFIFVNSILNKKKIKVFNFGKMKRDFTYIDDIVSGTLKIINKPPKKLKKEAPYRICNIGNNNPVDLEYFIKTIEKKLQKKSKKIYLPIQKGDIPVSFANVNKINKITGYKPTTKIEKGISEFITWYKSYYKIV